MIYIIRVLPVHNKVCIEIPHGVAGPSFIACIGIGAMDNAGIMILLQLKPHHPAFVNS
ncbi:hypothetical protein [Chitinophaga sp. 180180018-3]|uniref:hypothetical protein n=1 Tax=Chitinophaga sp. 180180018-3 TaxID=3108350 RepID=UPI0030CCD4CA